VYNKKKNDKFMILEHVSEVGPPTLFDQFQTCTNILQILCNNLQTSTLAVGIVSKLGGQLHVASPPTSFDRPRTGANILQII